MATAVGMNFKMTASIAKFQASMDKVESKLSAIEKSGKKTANGMKLLAAIEVGRSVLNGLTGLFNIVKSGVSSVVQFSSEAAAAADAIGKLSSATGMAEEPLQVFTQIASYSGVSSTQFGDALQKMSRGLGEAANGTGTAARGLQQLGLSVDSLLSMSPSEQFLAIGSAIGKIEDPARRSAIAADVFGRSGTKLIPMFEDLEKNARGTATEMLELGQVLSGTQVDNIEAMNDSFEKVRQTAFKIGSQVLANFAPALTEANGALLELIKNFEYEGVKGGQGLANFLTDALFTAAKSIAETLEAFINNFQTAVEWLLKGLADLLDGLAIGLSPFVGAENTVGMQNAAMAIDHFASNLGFAEVELTDLVDGAIASFRSATNESADSLAGFAVGTSLTDEAIKNMASGSLSAGDAMAELTGGIVNAANVVPISLQKLGAATERAVMSLDISGPANAFKNALDFLKDPTGAVGAGMGWLKGQLQDILDPLGFTEQAILDLGKAASQRKSFTDQILQKHMTAWDRTATMVRDKLIANGMNPYTAHAKMLAARAEHLREITGTLKTLEVEHIRNTGELTGSMEGAGEKIAAAGKVVGEKLSGAATTAAEWATGLAKDAGDWLGGLFGGGDGEGGPTLPEAESTLPELQVQTTTLSGILTAVQGFGSNFVQASF